LAEETGLVHDDVGPIVFTRAIEHEFDGVCYDQTEVYFLVRAPAFTITTGGWTPVETATVVEHRWWSKDALRSTRDTVFPEALADYLETV
jgi:hypothetical protein